MGIVNVLSALRAWSALRVVNTVGWIIAVTAAYCTGGAHDDVVVVILIEYLFSCVVE